MSTPAELYRNAIDLNRYSNSVAKRIIVSYNDLLVDTAQRLAGLDAVSAPAKAARLRATLGQLKTSLNAWASNSTALSVRELEELAGVQAGFVERELREAIPLEFRDQVRSVEISPRFAEAVATADPTQQGIVSLSDDLEAAVKGAKDVVRVTVADGVTMTLPNGQVLKNSFANMAQKEAAFFGQAVRNGFLTGESTDSIIRRLKGRLVEGDAGPISQILRAGGESTVRANNQIRTLVRTSVNQVANAASMKAYEANQDITKKYRYTATLDSRTSPICRALDGTEHLYGKGPIPPQHFNCRSTTVPIVDYEGLGFDPPPPSKLGRPGGDKNIPDGENYGPWLKRQPKAVQEKVLGDKGQVGYFNALSRKYGPDGAIRRFVREDGSEKTIEDLKRAYGDPSKIKAKPKAKPKPQPALEQQKQSERVLRPGVKNELVFQKQGGTAKMFDDSFKLLEQTEGEVGKNVRKMRRFMEKQEIVMHPSIPEKFANAERFKGNQALLRSQRKAVEALEKQKNDPGGLNGARSLLKAIEEGDMTELKHVMGKASGAAGYTTRSSGIVNAAMTPSSTTFNKKRIKAIIESAEDSLKRENAYIDFYKPGGGWGSGQTAPKGPWTADGLGDGVLGPDNWLPTSIHEVGHQVHFRGLAGTKLANKYKGLKGERFVSKYSHQNEKEQFAEAFVQYVLNPKGLKASHPRLHQWVDDALEEGLK